MNNQFLDIFLQSKVDFSKTIVEINGGSGGLDYFDIKPKDFIRYAKGDLKSHDTGGLINSITNAKRAIDCQIDTVLKTFGIEFDKLPKASEIFINNIDRENIDLPQKLKLIQALKIAPGSLTSSARTLRNKLEHYYKIPTKREIEEAIEIAELFVLSCESKTKLYEYDYTISDQAFQNNDNDFDKISINKSRFTNYIQFGYDEEVKKFSIKTFVNDKCILESSFNPQSPEYYFLFRMLNSLDYTLDFKESLSYLLSYIKHPIPKENINILEMNN